ncbi:amidase [uncultured Alsobacter sp.]|uniref:amidase n=1 Tax=uncultured Alsobacter sp. TaxID=1748258 RepID=UPI0025F55C8F|nr:amidase [uncultured Alsobacter sp.]
MISLLSILADIDAGRTSPERSLSEAQRRIAAEDGSLHAFASVAPERAFAPRRPGPLLGIAVGIKDIIDTADLPTEMGCPSIWGGWQPRADAPVVGLVKAAGGVVAGKTVTTALAQLDPSPTLNPHDPARTPGGSSSGSAAAVAAGLVPLALGTQTGGSVIRPASFCGVAAVKPSFRLIPTVGVKTQAWTLDTVGLFAATVADCAFALAAISGRDLAVDREPGAPAIGIVRPSFGGAASPQARSAIATAAAAAERAGCRVVDIDLPAVMADAFEAAAVIGAYEMRVSYDWEFVNRKDDLPPVLRAALERADGLRPYDYDQARGRARRARTAVRSIFEEAGVDVFVTYASDGVAPGRETTGDPRFNRLWTLLGVPCVNVPGIRTRSGLPLGLQVVAPFARDQRALTAAALLEEIWRDLEPLPDPA